MTQRSWHTLVVYASFFLLLLLPNLSVIDSFPSGRHTWTQSDHFAIAQRFSDGETSFWYPKSWDLKPDYSPLADPDFREGITKADFPIFLWLSGKMMQLTNSSSPFIPRLIWTALAALACLGVYMVFRSSGQKLFEAFVFSCILVLSPMWIYYSSSLIPSVVGFCFFACGFWMLIESRERTNLKLWLSGAILFTLAMLSRPPLVLFVAPILAWEIWRAFRNGEQFRMKVIVLCLLALATLGYEIHMKNVAAEMGSIFLLSPEYPESINQGWKWLKLGFENNLLIWFNPAQLLALVVIVVMFSVGKKTNAQKIPRGVALSITLLSVLYMLVMSKQFRYHDYYAIDVILPLLLLWLYILSTRVSRPTPRWVSISFLIVIGVSMVLNTSFLHFERSFDSRNMTDHANWWYSELRSESVLAQFDFQDRVAIIDAYSNNRPLAIIHRKGYTVINTSEEKLEGLFESEWEKAVVPIASWTNELLPKAPWLRDSLTPSYVGGRIMVLERSSRMIRDYVLSTQPERVLHGACGNWGAIRVFGNHSQDSCDSVIYDDGIAFPLTIGPLINEDYEYSRLTFEFSLEASARGNLKWVVSNDLGYYKEEDLNLQFPLHEAIGPSTFLVKSIVPHQGLADAEWKCYLWNQNGAGSIVDWSFIQEDFSSH